MTTFSSFLAKSKSMRTYIGGKDKNRHWDKKTHNTGGEASNKMPVIGAISRKGNVVCKAIQRTDRSTLNRFLKEAVSHKVTLLATDEHPAYGKIADYPHQIIRHGDGVYVRGNVHTNSHRILLELVSSCGVVGTSTTTSPQYLPLFLKNSLLLRFKTLAKTLNIRKVIAGCWDAFATSQPATTKPQSPLTNKGRGHSKSNVKA